MCCAIFSATVGQLLEHRWVTGSEVATVQLTSALEELRRFNARRKFKAAVSTVQATISLNKAFSKSKSTVSDDGALPKSGEEVSADSVALELEKTA